jgi:hypothetical protein
MNKTLFTILFLGYTFFLNGQVTSASMTGKVMATNGETLLGVAIVATHEPTGTKYTVICDENGIFHIENMTTGGPYTITSSLVGYQEGVQKDVFLSLGNAAKVNFTLEEANTELKTVEVLSKKNELFDGRRGGTQTNIAKDAVENMPTLSRSLQDLTRLTPQGGANSFAGSNFRYNNLAIDGAVANDAYAWQFGKIAAHFVRCYSRGANCAIAV